MAQLGGYMRGLFTGRTKTKSYPIFNRLLGHFYDFLLKKNILPSKQQVFYSLTCLLKREHILGLFYSVTTSNLSFPIMTAIEPPLAHEP